MEEIVVTTEKEENSGWMQKLNWKSAKKLAGVASYAAAFVAGAIFVKVVMNDYGQEETTEEV